VSGLGFRRGGYPVSSREMEQPAGPTAVPVHEAIEAVQRLLRERDAAHTFAMKYQAEKAELAEQVRRLAARTPDEVSAHWQREADRHERAAAELDIRNSELREENRLLRLELAELRGQSVEADWTGTDGAPR
jgi:hypothetical protein